MDLTPEAQEELSIKQKTDRLSEEIMQIDPVTGERLVDIGNSLDNGEFWLNLDLNNVINYSHFIARATAFFHKKSRQKWVIEKLELLRNLLVLGPILLTWIALSEASAAYKTTVTLNPALLDRPFLLLWQEGFPGANVLSFSTVALIDGLIIIVVLIITAVVLSLNSNALEKAEQKALEIGNRLQNLLWQIAKEAKPVQAKQISRLETRSMVLIDNMDKVIRSFEAHNRDLEELFRSQHNAAEDLATQRNKEILGLQGFIKIFEQAVSNLSAFSTQFLGILEDVKNANRTTAEGFARLTEMANHIQRLEQQIAQLSAAISQWGQNQQKSVQELTGATAGAISKAEIIASAIPEINAAIKTLTRAQNDLVNLFSGQKEETQNWITELQMAVKEIKITSEQIASTMQGLNNLTGTIHDSLQQANLNSSQVKTLGEQINSSFADLQTGIKHLDTNLVETAKIFHATLDPTRALSSGLNVVAGKMNLLDSIGHDLTSLQKRLQEMNAQLGQTSDTMEKTYYSNMDYAKVLEREISNLRAALQKSL